MLFQRSSFILPHYVCPWHYVGGNNPLKYQTISEITYTYRRSNLWQPYTFILLLSINKFLGFRLIEEMIRLPSAAITLIKINVFSGSSLFNLDESIDQNTVCQWISMFIWYYSFSFLFFIQIHKQPIKLMSSQVISDSQIDKTYKWVKWKWINSTGELTLTAALRKWTPIQNSIKYY